MNFVDNFMKKISRRIVDTFPHMLPQQTGTELLYVAGIMFIVRMCSFSIFVGGTVLEPEDLLGSILTGIGILAFVMRRRGLSESTASVLAGGMPVSASMSQKNGWNAVFIALLVFNLVSYFPGDLYYTMDAVIFFFVACTTYLQGETKTILPKQDIPSV